MREVYKHEQYPPVPPVLGLDKQSRVAGTVTPYMGEETAIGAIQRDLLLVRAGGVISNEPQTVSDGHEGRAYGLWAAYVYWLSQSHLIQT